MLHIPRASNECNAPLRATLTGSERCAIIPRFTAISAQPVIALCRTLLAAGFDAATPLDCYRGDTLALRVRSIGEAARLEINGKGSGFKRLSPVGKAAPIEQMALEAAELGLIDNQPSRGEQ